MISQDFGVNEATDQNPADFPLSRSGNGSVTNSQKGGQVTLEEGNRSGDSRVHARMCLGPSRIKEHTVPSTPSMCVQGIALEQPTKETVKEVKKLRIKKDQESTKVQRTTTKINTCSTTITKDVEEPGSEKGSNTAIAAVPFPGELNEETRGNSRNRVEDKPARWYSIDCCCRQRFDLKDRRYAGNRQQGCW